MVYLNQLDVLLQDQEIHPTGMDALIMIYSKYIMHTDVLLSFLALLRLIACTEISIRYTLYMNVKQIQSSNA